MFSRYFVKRNFGLGASSLNRNTSRVSGSSYRVIEELGDLMRQDCNVKANISKQIEHSRVSSPEYNYVPFREIINRHRRDAQNSIFVQVKSEDSADDLSDYCSRNFGAVKALHFHRNPKDEEFSNFFIVEFESDTSVQSAIYNHSKHVDKVNGNSPLPVYSPFLWFAGKESSSGLVKGSSLGTNSAPIFISSKLVSTDEELSDYLKPLSSLDDQMRALHTILCTSSISTRIRFLACHQVELCLRGLFANAEVLPFGSSVNSFGKKDSDLDMIVSFDHQQESHSRLMFHAKCGSHGSQRLQCQRLCDQISNMLQHFLPGCQDVQNILHARVPIVKYRQQLLGLECDLSVYSLSGFYMSELLYMFGELDSRVRPLVFTLRRWARDQGLIHDLRPTQFFTNFTITIMAIFFLQKKYKMLPPLSLLQQLAGPEDNIICDDGVQCKFIRNISGLQPQLNSRLHDETLTLEQMVTDFFLFYSREFNFNSEAICVISGEPQPKRFANGARGSNKNVSYFVDTTNPLEPDLNVSGNVQEHALRKFIQRCDESLCRLTKISASDGPLCDNLPKLLYLLSCDVPSKFAIKIHDLGGWKDEHVAGGASKSKKFTKNLLQNGIQTSNASSEANEKFIDEKRRQEFLKKKYLRVPKMRTFFDQKF